MAFKYSGFISYRRNEGDMKFLKNFKSIIASEAQKVTNQREIFFDEDSIEWGNDFDQKIYDSILGSYFFIPIYHCGYLHPDSLWCARELYHALKVEGAIREALGDKSYCFILPIIFRGSPAALPNCINKKKVKEIRMLEAIITSNRTNGKLTEFKNYIYDTFLASYKMVNDKKLDFYTFVAKVDIPTDEDLREWIKAEKKNERDFDSDNPPILI